MTNDIAASARPVSPTPQSPTPRRSLTTRSLNLGSSRRSSFRGATLAGLTLTSLFLAVAGFGFTEPARADTVGIGPSGSVATPVTATPPFMNDLSVWLDASNERSIQTNAQGAVSTINNLGGSGGVATIRALGDRPAVQPTVQWMAPNGAAPGGAAFQGRGALRFNGTAAIELGPIANAAGPMSVFVVFQRGGDLNQGPTYQRLVSAWDGEAVDDWHGNGFGLPTGEAGGTTTATVFHEQTSQAARDAILIGANAMTGQQRLHGEVAEVLVYWRQFSPAEQRGITEYLENKWGIGAAGLDEWTLEGPLVNGPIRTTDDLPLSDQVNAGDWTPFAAMTDEFEHGHLNPEKWYDHDPSWYGRAPSRFVPANVQVRDETLTLTMSRDDSLATTRPYGGQEYHTYAGASVRSVEPVLYGYFEVSARAMDSAASSSWWFTSTMRDQDGGEWRTEIDVFELGGASPGREHSFHMNAHVFKTPESREHLSRGGTWRAPFRFTEDFHTYGLLWSPQRIVWFVDGVAVRSIANTHWHSPEYMLFDTETMGDWLGMPRDEDLPSTYSVRYVRAWKNDVTRGREISNFTTRHDTPEHSRITRQLRREGLYPAPE